MSFQEALEALCDPPSGPARALHPSCYTDPAFWRSELEHVLRPAWHPIARSDELPNVGGHLVRRLRPAEAEHVGDGVIEAADADLELLDPAPARVGERFVAFEERHVESDSTQGGNPAADRLMKVARTLLVD